MKYFTALTLLLLTMVGCSNADKENQIIKSYTSTSEVGHYTMLAEIKDKDKIEKVKEIVDTVDWEKNKLSEKDTETEFRFTIETSGDESNKDTESYSIKLDSGTSILIDNINMASSTKLIRDDSVSLLKLLGIANE